MDSKLAIATIKESCYQVGYPTHDAEYERRKLINKSCDYAINCIEKLEKIKQIVNSWDGSIELSANDWKYISKIKKVLE